jgi:hypothetical protein
MEKVEGRRSNKISIAEQGMSNVEGHTGDFPSSFDIPCSAIDILLVVRHSAVSPS